jgi:hypothetical protein
VSLAWRYGREPDLAGYEVFRAASAGGPYTLGAGLLPRPAFVDAASAVPSFYVVRAVDTSGNVSRPSRAVSASPAPHQQAR